MSTVRNQREIVDRRALDAALEELWDEHGAGGGGLRAAALAQFKKALKSGRVELSRRLGSQEPGDAIARGHAFLMDQLIRVLYDHTTGHVYRATNPTAGERLSLIAVGGYGRGELAPYSDVDLLFLRPYKTTPWGESVIEYMLYMLWDLGLKVGHATRTIDDCIRLGRSDLTICTALLEARYLWGDQGLYGELRTRFQKEIVQRNRVDFVERKLAERDERHTRFGDSRYVVEPNLKEGKGGLRDLHTLFWIAKYLYRVTRVADLVEIGVLTAEESRRFATAERFLWTVRCHLHEIAGRAEERLTFDVQPELARRLGYTQRAGAGGTERFMKHYFLIAKDVGDLTRILCTALEEEHKRKPVLKLPRFGAGRREIEGFLAEGGRLNVADADVFKSDPVAMLRLFHVAQQRNYDIHPNALRLIRRSLKLINRTLRADPEANRIFLDILTSSKDPETTLRRMSEAGVLGRFITDFGRVVAQTQYDMYHHYTVDEHTIRAIGLLWRIEQGVLAEDHPLANDIIHKVLSRRVLYMAVFLHDIAKGRGGDHSELGAAVARKLCPRLGLSAAETETVAWLVLHHLAMSATAFKRDLGDRKTVEDFVNLVQSLERLRLLLVLTVADIRAVGPNVWNGWKGQLLRELYYRAEEAMAGGLITEGRERRIAASKEALAKALADWPEADIAAYLDRQADSYWLSADTETQVRHARMIREADRDDRKLAVETRVDTFQAVTEVTVYTADHPGLFARIAGAMAFCGANIVEARIFTSKDGMALDTFHIQDADDEAFRQPSRLAKLSVAIERTLYGEIRPHRELANKSSPYPTRSRVFTVEPVVLIDNNASASWTVIEVNGRDRPGLLNDLTRAFFELSLSIGSARIQTYGVRAVDVFYVRDLFGLKVTHAAKLKKIESALLSALMTPEQRRAADKAAADRAPARTPSQRDREGRRNRATATS